MRLKKLIAFVLCLTLTLHCVVGSVFAYDIPEEYFPYAVDENGYIIGEGDVVTFNAASLLLQGGSAGVAGFVGGSASIMPGVAAVVGLIAATGLVIYSVEGIATEAYNLYNLLSPVVQQALTDAYNAYLDGSTNALTVTEQIATEFNDAFTTVFYNDDGTLAQGGVTFDASNLLQYDRNTQYVYGSELTSSIYKYPLTAGGAAISGTTISVALDSTPVLTSGRTDENGLLLINSATNASLEWTPYAMPTIYDCSQLSISAPAVESLVQGQFTYHILGFWILDECSVYAAGEYCNHHTARYQSCYVRDSSIREQNACMMFHGTDTLVDDLVIDGWYLRERSDGRYVINWIFDTMVDGVSGVDRVMTPVERLLTQEDYVISAPADIAKVGVGDLVYMPTTDALANAESITQTGALTGVYDGTITDSPAVDTPIDQTGFWATLWDWLQRILDAILSIPAKLGEILELLTKYLVKAPAEWLANILTPLLEACKSLLLGMWGFISDSLTDLVDKAGEFFAMISDGEWFESLGEDSDSGFWQFFEFMRELWTTIPAPIRQFITASFMMLVALAVLKSLR